MHRAFPNSGFGSICARERNGARLAVIDGGLLQLVCRGAACSSSTHRGCAEGRYGGGSRIGGDGKMAQVAGEHVLCTRPMLNWPSKLYISLERTSEDGCMRDQRKRLYANDVRAPSWWCTLPRSARATRSWCLGYCPKSRGQYVDRRAAVQSSR